jgi:molybdenum cofactor cytidylyltransferase
VLFRREVFPELLRLTGDQGARPVIHKEPARVEWVELDLPMPPDVDTPGDYEKIRATLRAGDHPG